MITKIFNEYKTEDWDYPQKVTQKVVVYVNLFSYHIDYDVNGSKDEPCDCDDK